MRSRPRLMAAALWGAAVYATLPLAWAAQPAARALVAWNAAALLYLALTLQLTLTDDAAAMRRHTLRQSDGRIAVLVLVVLAAAAVLLAVGSQLTSVKDMHGTQRTLHVALAALTGVSSWLFTQVLFALHYAHDFYLARLRHQDDPLLFPGTPEPGYGDFIYFACVIGTSGQTADVSFNGPRLRRVGTLHCVLAFFFNATLLALTINIAAGLL